MSRLIDAEKLINEINRELERCSSTDREIGFDMAIDIVKQQPTAFDTEKVEQELKDWTFEADIHMPFGEDAKGKKIIMSDNTIAIIRKGGVE